MVFVVALCPALVGVRVAKMGVANGCQRLGSECRYSGLARWVGRMPGMWSGCGCPVVWQVGEELFLAVARRPVCVGGV